MPEFLWRTDESPGRRILLSPLVLAEWAYRAGARIHRALYDLGLRARVRVPLRVISVGNLAVGGSGKSPVAAWLAGQLRSRGEKVAILSRGVGGQRQRKINVVSDGVRVLRSPGEVGDEPVLAARAARGVPVLAGRNRAALALHARALFGVEIVVLDDGFQHHRLARDLDLVCVDAKLGLGNGHVLPRGPLRESPAGLRRADALIWTRAEPGWTPTRLARSPHPQFVVPIVPVAVRDLASGRADPLAVLQGARVGLLAAVARPDRLERDLTDLGASVAARRLFSDHHLYRERDLAELDPTLLWITTSKDAVKIPTSWMRGRKVAVIEEEVRPEESGRLIDWITASFRTGPR
jgi:tetraacyldisaccharide 4'-kinase